MHVYLIGLNWQLNEVRGRNVLCMLPGTALSPLKKEEEEIRDLKKTMHRGFPCILPQITTQSPFLCPQDISILMSGMN